MELTPERTTYLVIASAVLHNMARDNNIPIEEVVVDEQNEDEQGAAFDNREGTDTRRRLINARFATN